MESLAKKRNQLGYLLTKDEFEATGTHFVSFWWAIFWKEALGALAIFALAWLVYKLDWVALLAGYERLAFTLAFGALCAAGFTYLMVEIFYAMLEKRFFRKRFRLLPVDKGGERCAPTLEQARALTWSFFWGHLRLPLIVLLAGTAIELLVAAFTDASVIGGIFWLLLGSFLFPWTLGLWLIFFSFSPHYYVYARPCYDLAGFRLAFVGE